MGLGPDGGSVGAVGIGADVGCGVGNFVGVSV